MSIHVHVEPASVSTANASDWRESRVLPRGRCPAVRGTCLALLYTPAIRFIAMHGFQVL